MLKNLGLALGLTMKFYSTLEKGIFYETLEFNIRIFLCRANSYLLLEKLTKGNTWYEVVFCPLPPALILNRGNSYMCKQQSQEVEGFITECLFSFLLPQISTKYLFLHLIPTTRARNLVVRELLSETKGSRLEPGS